MLTEWPKILFFILLVTLQGSPAHAVQSHGGSEGLVVHQLGHILFVCGTGYLLFHLRALESKKNGWREFRTFLWLLIVWNLMTFAGHWLNSFETSDKFIKDHANTLYFTIDNLTDAIYYLTRLDHLILVPAFVFLLLALRKWRTAS